MLDRYALYELCVQAPLLQAAFLRAVHGGRPLLLREDFSGRAALARAWLAQDEQARAWAVDSDGEALGLPAEALGKAPEGPRYGAALPGRPAAGLGVAASGPDSGPGTPPILIAGRVPRSVPPHPRPGTPGARPANRALAQIELPPGPAGPPGTGSAFPPPPAGSQDPAGGPAPRLVRRLADVLAPSPGDPPMDVIHAGNFSLGYLPDRRELSAYLRACRARLAPSGILATDAFGGVSAFQTGFTERVTYLPDGRRVRTLWRRVEADPIRGTVVNTLSFRVDREGEVELDLPEAFHYRWRLWSLPELREALIEAGFESVEGYLELDPSGPRPAALRDLGPDWTLLVISR